MSSDWKTPIEPRTIVAQAAAIRVLELLSASVPGTENVEKACKEVLAGYERTGKEAPVGFSTLRKYADVGIVVQGYPGLARPFLEVLEDVRAGKVDLKGLGGEGLSLKLREATLDQAYRVAQGVLEREDATEQFAKKPGDLTALIGKLSDGVKLEKGVGKEADLWALLDGINKEEALKVLGVIFKRFPGVAAELMGGDT